MPKCVMRICKRNKFLNLQDLKYITRWIIDKSEREIFEYVPGVTTYDKDYDLLEKTED